MKKIILPLILFCALKTQFSNAQALARSSLNCFGNTSHSDKINLQQTAGQSGNYANFHAEHFVLRQGFLQSNARLQDNFFADAVIGIYPNPANGIFYVQVKSALDTQLKLQIFNVMGDLIHEQNISTNLNQSIDAGNLASGVYFVRLLSPGQQEYNSKLIVNR